MKISKEWWQNLMSHAGFNDCSKSSLFYQAQRSNHLNPGVPIVPICRQRHSNATRLSDLTVKQTSPTYSICQASGFALYGERNDVFLTLKSSIAWQSVIEVVESRGSTTLGWWLKRVRLLFTSLVTLRGAQASASLERDGWI